MSHRVLASGPIIRGNGTLPHRVVLLVWYYETDDMPPTITKLSVHTQRFMPPDFPKTKRSVSIDNGHYFTGDDREIEAPLAFARRVAEHLRMYGRDIDVSFRADEYRHALGYFA